MRDFIYNDRNLSRNFLVGCVQSRTSSEKLSCIYNKGDFQVPWFLAFDNKKENKRWTSWEEHLRKKNQDLMILIILSLSKWQKLLRVRNGCQKYNLERKDCMIVQPFARKFKRKSKYLG
jgi:hypothetical protein